MNVERLTEKDREDAVRVLVISFYDYPVLRYVLDDHPEYDAAVEAFAEFSFDKRLLHDWPVLGVRSDGELVAVATVSEPAGTIGEGMGELEERFAKALGTAGRDRMARFDQATRAIEPREPHHHVGMLGTLPAHQGQGHGRKLLDYVKNLSIVSDSHGVALTTEDPANVSFYKRQGFDILGEADVDELHSWILRWRNDQRR